MQTTEKTSTAESLRKTDPEDADLVILGGGGGLLASATRARVRESNQP